MLGFSVISKTFQLYRGGQFYWWKKLEYPEKTTDLPQVTDQLYHISEIRSPYERLCNIQNHTLATKNTQIYNTDSFMQIFKIEIKCVLGKVYLVITIVYAIS